MFLGPVNAVKQTVGPDQNKQMRLPAALYGKCPKNSNTKASDKMTYTNSVDPDQTAPEGAVWSGSKLFAIPLNI